MSVQNGDCSMASFDLPSRFFHGVILSALLTVAPLAAHAADAQEVANAVDRSASTLIDSERAIIDQLTKQMETSITGVQQTLVVMQNQQRTDQRSAMPIPEIETTFLAMPMASAIVDQITHEVMFSRQSEMNRVKMDERADYLLDTTSVQLVNSQAYDIFMRYFCDPKGRNGTMADTKEEKVGVKIGKNTFDYDLGCGKTSIKDVPSRHSLLGSDKDDGPEALAVIGLPTRPDALFFEPTTFPSKSADGKAPTSAGASNTSRLAHIYYAAFNQSLLFLLGEPPSAPQKGVASSFITNQGLIARQMMATYPFAILFAERMGTMGPDAAASVANLLRTKLRSATEDQTIFNILENLKRRNTISTAEYMDVVMYQLPLSPGYYTRINEELNPTELRRELVWLTAMQTALNYQRNRWLEILAALEAVR